MREEKRAGASVTAASGPGASGPDARDRRANYNVIAMTDLTGRELERYHYTPYGELEVSVESHMFDYDDDGDVDANDIAAGTSSGVCWESAGATTAEIVYAWTPIATRTST